ncbi:AMP nucleosidase [Variovorax boronicumulans]|jgi:AMP nucleosidase|uniref:AMP nucleosidase n=2 Tax=Variovorax TaxID=34072 RepID=A0AAW8D438_9BURK|nr:MULTISPECIES: AMP nucleosidase [Variovorax]ADU39791.1 AMP nucleosidase [Variovorax paradoxus EPS]MDP9894762.1 AMP nucleosidase [Variovorax boronicumulans]MDP9994920.1 AMP nucleosidase [Variovorax boronicumulans]MDQ0044122.1 AMP nucleosidase [Variovorax boronicumulans]MDQ0054581.1 AMP nucleosidase [Variovorax boronicumulans]
MPYMPTFVAPARFTDAAAALEQVKAIYQGGLAHLRESMLRFVAGEALPGRVRACYPFVRVHTHTVSRHTPPANAGLSYGFVAGPGRYETTLTRPDLFSRYYLDQFRLLLENHQVELEVGTSTQPIPIHFSFAENDHIEGTMSEDRRALMRDVFDLPDLGVMDDGIANGTYEARDGEAQPLSLFTAARVDYSLHRLRHYTGTAPEWFQNFVLFTNYQFYIDEFVRLGHEAMADENSEYIAFIEPGNVVTRRRGLDAGASATFGHLLDGSQGTAPPRLPQMPAYHLVREDYSGITMTNIGVGPANAKTITDHIAVLRPHAWMMLGHCAGLRNTQQLGDYVLAHAYVREDHVLDEELPLWVPIPALSEIQLALEKAVADITRYEGPDLKKIMRTGTVASTDNRNWELLPGNQPQRRFSQSRAVALDMESATIAANGFRFRVPYGTLLCVSDKPLHGEIKLPGMANHFYRERVEQHLRIGMRAIDILREEGSSRLHSRKLRSFAEVAFQ